MHGLFKERSPPSPRLAHFVNKRVLVFNAALTMDTASNEYAQTIVRIIESAVQVRRRYQFFVWSQSSLQVLVPHQLAVCGAYQRARREVVFEALHSIALPPHLLTTLTDGNSLLMQQLTGAWVERRGRPLALDVAALGGSIGREREVLLKAGFEELLVHGISRPQRPAEVESLFILGTPGRRSSTQQQGHFELLMPYLHNTWLRVQSTERELAAPPSGTQAPREHTARGIVTDRELQILSWVREGKSNLQISEQLGISALTVKNHVQKILRKLGAANRAQAVAKAMALHLLGRMAPDECDRA